MKKLLIFISIFFIYTGNVKAVNNNDMVSFYFSNFFNWTLVEELPVGKDLLIYKVNAEDLTTFLEIRDNGGPSLTKFNGKNEYNDFILIRDKLEVQQDPNNQDKSFTIFAYYVDENIDLSGYIHGDNLNINKGIFTKDQVIELYKFELIVMSLIALFIFFVRIIGVKNNFRLF